MLKTFIHNYRLSLAMLNRCKENIMYHKFSILFLTFFLSINVCYAQEDLESMFRDLDNLVELEETEVIATFKSTKVIMMPSIERVKKNQLHFRVSHLFGSIGTGIGSLFGLDQMTNMNLSFEYGLTNSIQLGFARSNKPDKTLINSIKWSIIRQKTGKKGSFSLSYFGNIDVKSRRYVPDERNKSFSGRIDYIHMLLFGKKVNSKFSFQFSPTFIHRNLVDLSDAPNQYYLIGQSGRYMLNDHISFNWEYFYNIPFQKFIKFEKDLFSLGVDIETGGHVFQLYFSNALALHPGKALINQNDSLFDGNVQFGFSILRAFNLN